MKNIISFLIVVFMVMPKTLTLYAAGEEGFVYNSKDKRNPFIPLVAKKAKALFGLEDVYTIDDVVLEGIVWDAGGDSVAILNGVIMREGQKSGNVAVIIIEEKSVMFSINNIEYTLDLIKKGE
ncbi:MAG: hypothetical protein ISS34_04510 [Candidatus Omnitrophica bacterium]|nr:hypothetical protein [Candidatus Omnitrophota bacterium]